MTYTDVRIVKPAMVAHVCVELSQRVVLVDTHQCLAHHKPWYPVHLISSCQ